MATFGQWLDDYAGSDNLVAGVATIWRTAKSDEDARPRVSAPQSITGWLAEHRGVHDESLRAAVRAYNESRGGRQATDAEVGAFKAMNAPPPSDAPAGHSMPIVDLSQPGPAVMAALGRIEQALDQRLGAIYQQVAEGFQAVFAWQDAQDERIKPITDLLGELAAAEDAPDDAQEAPGSPQEPEQGPDGAGVYVPPEQPTGSMWRSIAAPEPDPERMAALGDPRLVEDEG